MKEDEYMKEWNKFNGERWKQVIDVDDFILSNYQEYVGNSEFLKGISKKTSRLWSRFQKMTDKEVSTGIYDIETSCFSGIDFFEAGYIDKKNEVIVGVQTDEPLKPSINPFISLDSSLSVIKNNGYRFDHDIVDDFKDYNMSYEQLLEDTYTSEVKKYKELGLFSNLADNYGRGYIVGDYRRLALYGIDYLILRKKHDLERLRKDINYSMVRAREEVVKQINSLKKIKSMAASYGYDISRPASNATEAIQWLYFGYLAASKEYNGASMPIGNDSAFLDIYIQRDIENGELNEEMAQELIDQFIIRLRAMRYIRTPEFYDNYLAKQVLINETIGGIHDNKSLITKTAFRMLNSIENLDECEVPSITILWSKYLPINFKKYCAKVMLKCNILQFVNGDINSGTDYTSTGVASLSKIGKQIEYNGGICNLPKMLLYAINGGRDEITGEQVLEGIEPVQGNILNYSEVVRNFSLVLRKVLSVHADALNILHCIHDKYAYESSIMAFNDTVVERYITIDLAGLSVLVDSLSAIRYTRVSVSRDENGICTEYSPDNKFYRFGNDKDEVDSLAIDIIRVINKILGEHRFYRNAKVKLGINSLGLNVVFGNLTGATPDGRFKNTPFAPCANPDSHVDITGLLNSLKSVMKLPNNICSAGIINTLNVNHSALGTKKSERVESLVTLFDEYFENNGNYMEMNIIDKSLLLENSNRDRRRGNLILRNSGCLVNYSKLEPEFQEDLMNRTFHKVL